MRAIYEQAEKRVERGFLIHLAVYILVVGGLVILNYNRNPDRMLERLGSWRLGDRPVVPRSSIHVQSGSDGGTDRGSEGKKESRQA